MYVRQKSIIRFLALSSDLKVKSGKVRMVKDFKYAVDSNTWKH